MKTRAPLEVCITFVIQKHQNAAQWFDIDL